jgi:hypothetical protein
MFSELPNAAGALLQRMECGHGCLSNSDRSLASAAPRPNQVDNSQDTDIGTRRPRYPPGPRPVPSTGHGAPRPRRSTRSSSTILTEPRRVRRRPVRLIPGSMFQTTPTLAPGLPAMASWRNDNTKAPGGQGLSVMGLGRLPTDLPLFRRSRKAPSSGRRTGATPA